MKQDPITELSNRARIRGAEDFCQFLRGKVDAELLLFAWEAFMDNYPANVCLRVPTNPATYSDIEKSKSHLADIMRYGRNFDEGESI